MADDTSLSDHTMAALIKAALEARDSAYAPYSKHPVGASLLDENGHIASGGNVENAAYPLGSCAEVTAIGNMVRAGGRKIRHMVVVGPGDVLCTPCGGCRQRIREFAEPGSTFVSMLNRRGELVKTYDFCADLLPDSFGPDNVNEVKSG